MVLIIYSLQQVCICVKFGMSGKITRTRGIGNGVVGILGLNVVRRLANLSCFIKKTRIWKFRMVFAYPEIKTSTSKGTITDTEPLQGLNIDQTISGSICNLNLNYLHYILPKTFKKFKNQLHRSLKYMNIDYIQW